MLIMKFLGGDLLGCHWHHAWPGCTPFPKFRDLNSTWCFNLIDNYKITNELNMYRYYLYIDNICMPVLFHVSILFYRFNTSIPWTVVLVCTTAVYCLLQPVTYFERDPICTITWCNTFLIWQINYHLVSLISLNQLQRLIMSINYV